MSLYVSYYYETTHLKSSDNGGDPYEVKETGFDAVEIRDDINTNSLTPIMQILGADMGYSKVVIISAFYLPIKVESPILIPKAGLIS